MITEFTAKLQGGENKGSWTYVVMPGSAEFFGTRGYIKIRGTVDGQPIDGSFMPLGDGTHMFPVKSEIREIIGKQLGDTVTVKINERLSH